jgi:HEAT repeat protein
MKQRALIVAAVAMIPFAVAAAQTPPAAPTKPAPAAAPTPAQKPLIAIAPYGGDPIIIDQEAIRRAVEDAKWQGQIASDEARRAMEDARWQMEDAKWALKDMKISMPDMKDFKVSIPEFNFDFKAPKFSGQAFMAGVPFEGQSFYSGRVEMPPPSFGVQGDPADSIYNLGREMIGRQDYSRGAAKLAEMLAKYPNSRNATAAAYWQAFALYRVGTVDALRTSLKVLETNGQQFQYSYSSEYRKQAPQLQARVLRALIERNEGGAEGKLRDLIAKYPAVSCDDEKIGIQSTVLSALYQTDPDAATPYIRQYLNNRDACTAELRRNAISILANRPSDDNTNLIVQIARNDTVRAVRLTAIEVLSRMPGDASVNALQQFMGDPDDQVQNAAVRSLMRSDNPRARSAMRQSLIDKRDAPERQRVEAIRSFNGDNMTPDDAAYLRALFNRAGESDRVKEAIVQALGNVPTEENLKFLMDVAQNQNESSTLRSYAFRSVTRRQNMTTDNLIKMYDATDNRSMRNSIVDALSNRGDPASIDKLLSIVKSSTDPEVRSNAIRELLGKNDKTITQKVLDLIGKP